MAAFFLSLSMVYAAVDVDVALYAIIFFDEIGHNVSRTDDNIALLTEFLDDFPFFALPNNRINVSVCVCVSFACVKV